MNLHEINILLRQIIVRALILLLFILENIICKKIEPHIFYMTERQEEKKSSPKSNTAFRFQVVKGIKKCEMEQTT